MTWSDEGLVTLGGGRVASLAALRLLWTLERRGIVFTSVGEHGVNVTFRIPPGGLKPHTPDEVAGLRAYRDDLLALTGFFAEAAVQ